MVVSLGFGMEGQSALDAALWEENLRRRWKLGFWPLDISQTAAQNLLNPEVQRRLASITAHGLVLFGRPSSQHPSLEIASSFARIVLRR